MAATTIPFGSNLAVQRWSPTLVKEIPKHMYFGKFIGTGNDSLIVRKTDLEKKKGDKITIGMAMKLTGPGVTGDNTLEGTSGVKGITLYDASLYIDQYRIAVKTAGRMTEKRSLYNFRSLSRESAIVYFAELYDEFLMCYLSGARGSDTTFKENTAWTGFANNSLADPDSDHIAYGGDATGKTDLDANDVMAMTLVERMNTKAAMLDPAMAPFNVNGEKYHVLLMSPFQAHSLKISTTTNDWADAEKYAGVRGIKNNLFTGSLGTHRGVILHSHRNVIQFNDYGVAGGLPAARALFLGAQAGMIAFGQGNGIGSYNWYEELKDIGNQYQIGVGSIFGVKKTTFNSKDLGIIALDTYAADPN